MKVVILKHQTISPVLGGSDLYVSFTYEILDTSTNLVDSYSIHRQVPGAELLPFEEAVGVMKQYCIDFCVQLEQSLNSEVA